MDIEDSVVWDIPEIVVDQRISLIRRLKTMRSKDYNFTLGVRKFGWFSADKNEDLGTKRSKYYYGRWSDKGSPGYREESSILPVTLSSFSAKLGEDGNAIISWTTESEIENAGFNILRSEKLKGTFIKVNPKLIQGAGTTGERTEYTWTDITAKPNIEYYYQIEDISFAGEKTTLATKRLKGIHSAKNRLLTIWGGVKRTEND